MEPIYEFCYRGHEGEPKTMCNTVVCEGCGKKCGAKIMFESKDETLTLAPRKIWCKCTRTSRSTQGVQDDQRSQSAQNIQRAMRVLFVQTPMIIPLCNGMKCDRDNCPKCFMNNNNNSSYVPPIAVTRSGLPIFK